MSRLVLIVNPAAARGRASGTVRDASAVLRETGVEHEVRVSASLPHARELATEAAEAGDVVVAVGGDGTVGALAGATAVAGGVFGVIPGGRGNDLARVWGIPSDPAGAARVLSSGRTREVDLVGLSVEGEPERMAAGAVYAGVPSVADEIANSMRLVSGALAYPIAALRVVARWRPAAFRVAGASTDVTISGFMVVVANSPDFAGGMRIAPGAAVDDGRLDVVTMRHASRLTFLRGLSRVSDGSHTVFPQVSIHPETELALTIDRDMPVGADGETLPFADPLPAGRALRIRVLPRLLRVLVPAQPSR